MPEPIPLSPALRVQCVKIVVSNILSQSLNLMLKAFAGECWDFGMIQGETSPIELAQQKRPVLQYFYSNGTISPVLISLAAAALTLVGVKRFNRPI